LAIFDENFRALSYDEEIEYRKRARADWKVNQCNLKGYVHPVTRHEWDKLDEELRVLKEIFAEHQQINLERLRKVNNRLDKSIWHHRWWGY